MNTTNKTLLMIRAKAQSVDFVAELMVSNPVIYAPMVDIEPLNVDQVLPSAELIIFTSSNAVRIYTGRTQDRSMETICVGSITARAATKSGFRVLQTFEHAQDLVEHFRHSLKAKKPIVYPRAETVSLDIAHELKKMGYTIAAPVLYRQSFQPLSGEGRKKIESSPTVVPVFSREIAKRFHETLISIKPENLTLVCISAPVAAIFNDLSGFSVEIVQKPTRDALIEKIKACLCA